MKTGGSNLNEALSYDQASDLAIPSAVLVSRLQEISQRTKSRAIKNQISQIKKGKVSLGLLNNTLMESYRIHACAESYSLLYELNYKVFFLIIFNKIKFYSNLLDPKDILQDVFLSIFRYPFKFRGDKENAFRNWSYSIIRNTILKHLKARESCEITTDILPEVLEDSRSSNPLASLSDAESIQRFKKFYLYYLLLYLHVFDNYLSERAKKALLHVEVECKRYREASDLLGIKLENFKMVVCRARKKIHRHLNQILGSAGS